MALYHLTNIHHKQNMCIPRQGKLANYCKRRLPEFNPQYHATRKTIKSTFFFIEGTGYYLMDRMPTALFIWHAYLESITSRSLLLKSVPRTWFDD